MKIIVIIFKMIIYMVYMMQFMMLKEFSLVSITCCNIIIILY